MELEQLKNEVQRQKEEIRALRDGMERLAVRVAQVAEQMQTKSKRTKKTSVQQTTTHTVSPATKFLDTLKFDKNGMIDDFSFADLFHSIQMYICRPDQFTEEVYRGLTAAGDLECNYDQADDAIIELAATPYITLHQFTQQIMKDGGYVEINRGTKKSPHYCIVERF